MDSNKRTYIKLNQFIEEIPSNQLKQFIHQFAQRHNKLKVALLFYFADQISDSDQTNRYLELFYKYFCPIRSNGKPISRSEIINYIYVCNIMLDRGEWLILHKDYQQTFYLIEAIFQHSTALLKQPNQQPKLEEILLEWQQFFESFLLHIQSPELIRKCYKLLTHTIQNNHYIVTHPRLNLYHLAHKSEVFSPFQKETEQLFNGLMNKKEVTTAEQITLVRYLLAKNKIAKCVSFIKKTKIQKEHIQSICALVQEQHVTSAHQIIIFKEILKKNLTKTTKADVLAKLCALYLDHADFDAALEMHILYYLITSDMDIFRPLARSKYFSWSNLENALNTHAIEDPYLIIRIAIWSNSNKMLIRLLKRYQNLQLLTDLATPLSKLSFIPFQEMLLESLDNYLKDHFGHVAALKTKSGLIKLLQLDDKKLAQSYVQHILKYYPHRRSLKDMLQQFRFST